MQKLLFVFSFLILVLISCNRTEEAKVKMSKNEFYSFFYPYDTIPKVYVYRDKVNGMEEIFHRVFSTSVPEGNYTVVETYSPDGRLIEITSYQLDSLRVSDHLVVKSEEEKSKTKLTRHNYFPMASADTGFLTQIIPINDSLLLYKETVRTLEKELSTEVLEKQRKTAVFSDDIKITMLIPNDNQPKTALNQASYYFSEGIGLSRFHTEKKEVDYQLLKIISQEEFVAIMSLL